MAFLFLATAACDDLVIVEYGSDEGVLPMWYEETLTGLPTSYTMAEWPDGVSVLETATGPVQLAVDTRADGGRDVTIQRSVWLLDGASAAFFRDFFGTEAIHSIRAIDLALLELDLDEVNYDLCGKPEIYAGTSRIHLDGRRASLDGDIVELMRSKLIAGEDIRIPLSLTFHLRAEALDALPPRRLHVYILVQPTLYVDVLAATL